MNQPEANCILCYRVCLASNNKKSERKLLDDQVAVIFILRKLLEVPKKFCVHLLSEAGNPSEWITSCDNCTELIDRAHSTFKEVIRLQIGFESLKSKIKTTISNSRLENHPFIISPHKNVNNTTDNIRKCILKDSNPVHQTFKFDPDLVVKVENNENNDSLEEENDWLPVNYDEEYQIAQSKENKRKRSSNTKKEKESPNPKNKASDDEDESYYPENDDNNSDSESEGNLDTENDKSEDKTPKIASEDYVNKGGKTCDLCGKTLSRQSHMKDHIRSRHSKISPHKCSQCNFTFTSRKGLKRHHLRFHPEIDLQTIVYGKLTCEICGQTFSADYIKYHMITHGEEEDKKFACGICEKRFGKSDLLKVHQRGVHYKELNLEPYECKECNKVFKTDKCLRGHEVIVHKVNVSISCSICGAAFRTNFGLTKHKTRKHEMEKFSCTECERIYNTKDKLDHHIFAQHTMHECKPCNLVFSKLELFRLHQRGVHEERFKCTLCDRVFNKKCHLLTHEVERHTKEFPIKCSICNAGFCSNGKLSLHVRQVHNKEKKFTCSYCGMGFFYKLNLEAHVISQHTKEYPFTCEICGHGSANISLLAKHKKTHGDKKYTCELCGDAFKLQYELVDHQRGKHYQEMGLKPFKCNDCSKIFGSRSNLRIHIIRHHTKTSNFPCSYCQKVFLSNQRLRDHTRRHHTGEKPHKCEICNESFFTNKEKQRHAEKHSININTL